MAVRVSARRQPLASSYRFAAAVCEQQVGHLEAREMHAERIDPDVVGQFGIARGDVIRETVREAVLREDPERAGEPLELRADPSALGPEAAFAACLALSQTPRHTLLDVA